MDRRVEIKKAGTIEVTEIIATLISQSLGEIRGDLPKAIVEALGKIDLNRTNLPSLETDVNAEELFTDERVNNLFDYAYMDLFIQYVDIFTLQDSLEKIRSLFDSTILASITRAGELASRLHDYEELSSSQFDFTDSYHETFNRNINQSRVSNRLSINPAAGILRLQGLETNYALPESSNIFLNTLSENAELLDENESDNAFGGDPSAPYYVTLSSIGPMINGLQGYIDFSDVEGVLVDLVIQFSGVFPINRICFSPFSTSPVGIWKVYASEVTDPAWHTSVMKEIELKAYSTDNAEIELNFDRVYARELHILLVQKDFVTPEDEVDIEDTLSVREFVESTKTILLEALPEGYTESSDDASSLAELLEDVKGRAERSSLPVDAGSRVYTVGVFGVRASNVSYGLYGEYEAENIRPDGNLASARAEYSEAMFVRGSNSGLDEYLQGGTLFSLVTSEEREIFLGDPFTVGSNLWVEDMAVIERNLVLEGDRMVPSSTHPYSLQTHFLVDRSAEFDLYIDSEQYTLTLSDHDVTWTEIGLKIALTAAFCERLIYEGRVVGMSYAVPSFDRFGKSYDVREVDAEKRLGKPNVRDNAATEMGEPHLYVLSGTPQSWIAYGPGEYYPVNVEGYDDEVFYAIGNGKGESAYSDRVLSVSGQLYVHEDLVLRPYSDFYYGVIGESAEDRGTTRVIDSQNYDVMRTELPYVKGSLKVFLDGIYTDLYEECDLDETGAVLTDTEKRLFYVYNSEDQAVTVSYIPLDMEASGTQGKAGSNVARPNMTEKFSGTDGNRLKLSRFLYHDNTIITSENFDLSNGVFYLKQKYSVIYEPIAVYVNGAKATNRTDYEAGGKAVFTEKKRENDYQYYLENGDSLVFNEEIRGNIIVYYYVLSDSFTPRVRMYRADNYRDDITPELHNYTLLMNIQRH